MDKLSAVLLTSTVVVFLLSSVLPYTSDASSVTVPPGILEYYPVTISNYQTTALSANTPIAIGVSGKTTAANGVTGISAISLQPYVSPTLNNGEFFYANGTIVNSWLEGNILNELQANAMATSYSSTNALANSANVLWWVNLGSNTPNELPVGSAGSPATYTIYYGLAATATNLWSLTSNTGVAPQLTCDTISNTAKCGSKVSTDTYAKYDNGNVVFGSINGANAYYTNWAGITLPPGWGAANPAVIYVNNGLMDGTGSASSEVNSIWGASNTILYVTEAMQEGIIQNGGGALIGVCASIITTGCSPGAYARLQGSSFFFSWHDAVNFANSNLPYVLNYGYEIAVSVNATLYGFIGEYIRYQTSTTVPTVSWYGEIHSNNGQGLTQWYRNRIAPPNEVLPASSFGGVVIVLAATPNPYTLTNKSIDINQASIANTVISNGYTGTHSYTGNWLWIPPTSSNIASGNTIIAALPATNNALTLTINAYSSNSLEMTFNGVVYWANAIGTNTIYGTWTINAFAGDANGDTSPSPALTNTLIIYSDPTTNLYFTSPASGTSLSSGSNAVANDVVTGGSGTFTYAWTINNVYAANVACGAVCTSNTFNSIGVGTYVYNVIVTDTGVTTPYKASQETNTLTVSAVSTPPTLSYSVGNSIIYGTPDTITAPCTPSSDNCAIWYGSTQITNAIGSVTYNAGLLAVGTYAIYANDLTAGLASSTNTLTVSQATPLIWFSVEPTSYTYNGIGGYFVANILDINNQLNANDFVNDVLITSFLTSNSYTTSNVPNTYTIVANTLGNGNYLQTSNTFTFTITAPTPILTYSNDNSITYGQTDTITASCWVTDTCAIWYGSTQLASGTGSVTYNAGLLAAGTYGIYSNDLTGGTTSAVNTLVISQATTFIWFPTQQSSYTYNAVGGYFVASITSLNNQLNANDYINNVLIMQFTTTNTYTTSAVAGLYTIVANTLGNANYILSSNTFSFSITQNTPIITFPSFPASHAYTGVPDTLTANIQTINNQVIANDFINNALITSFNTQNSVTEVNVGAYTMVANTFGNANYIAGTNTVSYTISAVLPTLAYSAGNAIIQGQTDTITANCIAASALDNCAIWYGSTQLANAIGKVTYDAGLLPAGTYAVYANELTEGQVSATNTLTVYSVPTTNLYFTTPATGNSISYGGTAVANDVVTGGSGTFTYAWTINNVYAANVACGAVCTSNTFASIGTGNYVYNVIVTDTGVTTPYAIALEQNTLMVSAPSTTPTFTYSGGNSIAYGSTDAMTASCAASDNCAIWYGNTQVTNAIGSVTYNAGLLAAGTYGMYANDITSSMASTVNTLMISKASLTGSITITTQQIQATGQETINDQSLWYFYIGGVLYGNTPSQLTISTAPFAPGTYPLTFSNPGNANYISYNTVSTLVIQNGGGGGSAGGGSSGGGGSSAQKPVILPTKDGYIVLNIAELNIFNVTLNGLQFNFTDNFISPNQTGMTINNQGYTLTLNKTFEISQTQQTFYNYTVKLLNISYVPILHTVAIEILGIPKIVPIIVNSQNFTTNITTYSKTIPVVVEILGSKTTLWIVSNGVGNKILTITNITNSKQVPLLPPGYLKQLIQNVSLRGIDLQSINLNTSINVTMAYNCSIAPNEIIPFILANASSWKHVNSFTVKPNQCVLNFTVYGDPILALGKYVGAQQTTTTVTGVQSTTTIPYTPLNPEQLWYLFLLILLILVVIAIIIRMLLGRKKKRKKKRNRKRRKKKRQRRK